MDRPWLGSYDPHVPYSLTYEDSPIFSFVERSARLFAAHTALIFMGLSMQYRELWKHIEQFTRALQALGVGPGERVLLFLPNCPHFIISYYAALRAGAVIVGANPLYSDKELAYQIQDSGTETLITLDVMLPQASGVLSAGQIKRVIVGSVQDFLPRLKKIIYPIIGQKKTDNVALKEKNNVFSFQKLLHQHFQAPGLPEVDPDDLAVLQYTGGTTGVVKGAMLTHRNIACNTQQIRRYYHILQDGRETFIAVLPFFHSYGMSTAMNLPLVVGATLIVFPRFQAGDILKAIVRYRATAFPGIPSIYSVLCTHKDIGRYDISSIKYCLSGAAPLPVTVLQDFERLTGGMILEGYGLSESSPVTHCNPVVGKRKVGSIGLPMPDTDCSIVDIDTGRELPPGGTGELCIRGPQVMQGYWRKEDETRLVLRDGWLSTGDVARMDEDGYFYIVERKKDMIICEGFNIYPREIEELLLQHPKIADACVIGVPDKLRGERVLAYVVVHRGEQAHPDEIMKYCRENLVKYKLPKKIIFKDEIPTTIAGKKLRRMLRQEASGTLSEKG